MEPETKRALLRMAPLGLALLLPLLSLPLLIAAALAAFLLALWRAFVSAVPGDPVARDWGLVCYPLSLLILLLLFPTQLHLVAGAWSFLAVGDGMATFIGRGMGGPSWGWNERKTIAGSAAFWATGSLAACLLMLWVCWWLPPAQPFPGGTTGLLLLTLLVGAVLAYVETLEFPLSDNLTVPLAAGVLLWVAFQLDTQSLLHERSWVFNLIVGIAVSVVLAVAVTRMGWAQSGEATAAVVYGLLFICLAEWKAWVVLVVMLVILRVVQLRLAEQDAGTARLIRPADVNLALCLALFGAWTGRAELAGVGLVGALVASLSQRITATVARRDEGPAVLLTTLRPAAQLQPGALSMRGLLCGVAAALLLGCVAGVFGLIALRDIPLAALSGLLGPTARAYLAARWPEHWNDSQLQWFNTMLGAAVMLLLYGHLAQGVVLVRG